MDTQHLHILVESARAGSFSAAAKSLDLDPSAVSRAIAGLEADLGMRLFERTTRRIALTEAGTAYLSRIAPLLDDLDAAASVARDLVDQPRGVLRISASTAFGQTYLVRLLAAYRRACPDVRVELALSDAQIDLVADRIDLAIRHTPEAPPDAVVTRLETTRYRVVAAPAFLSRHRLKRPADLGRCDCLVFPFEGFRDTWRFRKGAMEDAIAINAAIEISGALALAEAARHGLGAALLADWLIHDDLKTGKLVDPFPDYDVAATQFDTATWVLYPSRAYLPLKTRRFIDLLKSQADRRR